jgi:hypothetical protein
MDAIIIKFPAERWQRYKTMPCPVHPEGRHWKHGEHAPGHGTYCRASDLFCDHDAERRALCNSEIGLRPDGTPLQHGDVVPGGRRFCERRRVRCECTEATAKICGSFIKKKRKGKVR